MRLTIVIARFRKISDAFFKEVTGHFIFTRCFSVGHSIYEEVEFPECGNWVPQSFLSADRSVGEDIRLVQERGVPEGVLVRTKVLGVLAIAIHVRAEVGYAPTRTCIFSHCGYSLLPRHRGRSRVSPYTRSERVVCVCLEKRLRCCEEVVIFLWARR